MLPSRYTSQESLDDAAACAKLLGVSLRDHPIETAVAAFGETLAPLSQAARPTRRKRTSSRASAA
jgi:NAD+ synthase